MTSLDWTMMPPRTSFSCQSLVTHPRMTSLHWTILNQRTSNSCQWHWTHTMIRWANHNFAQLCSCNCYRPNNHHSKTERWHFGAQYDRWSKRTNGQWIVWLTNLAASRQYCHWSKCWQRSKKLLQIQDGKSHVDSESIESRYSDEGSTGLSTLLLWYFTAFFWEAWRNPLQPYPGTSVPGTVEWYQVRYPGRVVRETACELLFARYR